MNPDERAELRELIRDAHGAIKDLDRLLADYRRIAQSAVKDAETAAQAAAGRELDRFHVHLLREADRLAQQLNRAVHVARAEIVKQLTVAEVFETPDGKLGIRFAGGTFDEHANEQLAGELLTREDTGT